MEHQSQEIIRLKAMPKFPRGGPLSPSPLLMQIGLIKDTTTENFQFHTHPYQWVLGFPDPTSLATVTIYPR